MSSSITLEKTLFPLVWLNNNLSAYLQYHVTIKERRREKGGGRRGSRDGEDQDRKLSFTPSYGSSIRAYESDSFSSIKKLRSITRFGFRASTSD
eukprot:605735-Amorphochlora_amoeboformis.AAC.1